MHLQRPDVHRRCSRSAPLCRQLAGLRDDRLVLCAVLHAVVQVPHLVAAVHLHMSWHVRLAVHIERRLQRSATAQRLRAAEHLGGIMPHQTSKRLGYLLMYEYVPHSS